MYVYKCDSEIRMGGLTKAGVQNRVYPKRVTSVRIYIKKSSPVTDLEWPRGLQEVKVPRFHDNGTGWW